ncbi:hypothetical protein KY084_11650 [Stakelama sp. CBK3Z-3]|uniref:Lipoprotein n=1 Tax=Stakelama flava TaxID=2860338 RepID=A0ABS6XMT7_9SPHN|nr:hypothetical protein [Stakelama flava]MBW4331522.1 hypothetical protein [Stakelama flava]
MSHPRPLPVRRFGKAARAALIAVPMILAGCSGGDDDSALDNLDSDLVDTANSTDPAVTGALQDQIMVDPTLADQRNGNAVRPPGKPYSGALPDSGVAGRASGDAGKLMQAPAPTPAKDCPACKASGNSVTLGALAQQQGNGRVAGCAADIRYSTRWAARMPTDMPLYPGAKVIEAAGTDKDACRLRIVNFQTSTPLDTMVNWYYTRARRAGFTAEHQIDGTEHILGGTRARDDGAYVLWLRPRDGGGTDIDIVTNNGG